MTIAKQSDFMNNITGFLDMAFAGNPVEISLKERGNVVIISKSDYEKMKKTQENEEYLRKIDRAIMQRQNGTMQEHDLIEV